MTHRSVRFGRSVRVFFLGRLVTVLPRDAL